MIDGVTRVYSTYTEISLNMNFMCWSSSNYYYYQLHTLSAILFRCNGKNHGFYKYFLAKRTSQGVSTRCVFKPRIFWPPSAILQTPIRGRVVRNASSRSRKRFPPFENMVNGPGLNSGSGEISSVTVTVAMTFTKGRPESVSCIPLHLGLSLFTWSGSLKQESRMGRSSFQSQRIRSTSQRRTRQQESEGGR